MNTSTDTWTWMRIGAGQGAKWGFLLALAYILWILWDSISTSFSSDFIQQVNIGSALTIPFRQPLENLPRQLTLVPFTLIAGSIVGGIPALLIGAMSGGILGGGAFPFCHSSLCESSLPCKPTFRAYRCTHSKFHRR